MKLTPKQIDLHNWIGLKPLIKKSIAHDKIELSTVYSQLKTVVYGKHI